MHKSVRQIFVEVLWLAISVALTILIVSLLFSLSFTEETIDFHIYDKFYVMKNWHVILPIYLLVTFIIYFVKELRNSFSRNLPNLLLVFSGLAFVISVTMLTRVISQSFVSGVTIYPPLSALEANDPVVTQDPKTEVILNFLAIIQFVVLFILVFVIYRWGKSRRYESF